MDSSKEGQRRSLRETDPTPDATSRSACTRSRAPFEPSRKHFESRLFIEWTDNIGGSSLQHSSHKFFLECDSARKYSQGEDRSQSSALLLGFLDFKSTCASRGNQSESLEGIAANSQTFPFAKSQTCRKLIHSPNCRVACGFRGRFVYWRPGQLAVPAVG